jgi:hypothetical protein
MPQYMTNKVAMPELWLDREEKKQQQYAQRLSTKYPPWPPQIGCRRSLSDPVQQTIRGCRSMRTGG